MPKIHALIYHLVDFVGQHEYSALYSEQELENYHQTSARVQSTRASNQTEGSSICVDVAYAYILSSPKVNDAF